MLKVLIVDDEEPIRHLLSMFIKREGFIPLQAGDGEEGLTLFRQESPPIVLTDARMPRMDGLTLIQLLKEEAPETQIALLTGHGDEALAVAALRAGAVDYLKKPLELDELELVLKKFTAAISAREKSIDDLRTCTALQIQVVLGNNLYNLPGVVAYLLHGFKTFLSKKELADLQLVLSELLLNAIEHGNLEISGKEKHQALIEDRFAVLIEERRADPLREQRCVSVELNFAQRTGEFRCHIRDEGEGFCWQDMPQEIKPEDLVLPHGRGILLSRLLVDQLSYNDAGNEVTVVKRLSTSAESAG
ncbi:MAG: response regulator [Candidatus Binatia bacterium]